MALVTLKSLGSVVSACSKRIWRACNAKVFSVAQQSSSSNAPLFELYASRRTSADLPWRTTSYDQRRMARIMNNAVVQRLVGSNSEASIFLPTRVLGGLSILSFQVYMAIVNPSRGHIGLLPEYACQVLTDQDVFRLNALLFEDKEFLEDMTRDLTLFIELQKDKISELSKENDRLRRRQ